MTISTSGDDVPGRLLQIIALLAREVRAGAVEAARFGMDSNLERDIGFDSLERAELLLRLEKAFGVRLPSRTLVTAETPRDLLRAVQAGSSVSSAAPQSMAAPLAEAPAAYPDHAQTLLEALEWHVATHPERRHLTLLAETETGPTEEPLTYRELRDESLRVAAGLAARGFETGQHVTIMLPTSRDFFLAFLGTLYAGGVPVPIYPPARRSQLEEHLQRQSRILANCEAVVLITVPEARTVARLLRAATPSLRHIVSVAELGAGAGKPPPWRPGAQDTAFLQYTSGSTGNPKGVILTHANLLANIRAIGHAIAVAPTDVFVSWLPLYHDMGLIGAWFGTLYFAVPLVVMSPTDFLSRPETWLRAIHRYRATLSAGPNFAYEMCASRLDAGRLAGLDLSSWRIAFNGAEPVGPDTLARFAERFAAYGFDARAQTPVYGLAEAAVGLAFPPLGRGPRIDSVDRMQLARTGGANPAGAGDPNALRVVACGRPLPGYEIRVVDAAGRDLPERREGRVEFRGPSATSGYFRNPEATRNLFDGTWLDTGDLGYFADGELFVTGRVKDVIIRGGQHIHPQEAETAIGAIPGIRKGCVTVFGVPDRNTGTEKIVVLAETRETVPEKREALRRAVAELMAALHGAPPDDVVLAPPHTVLKTSSGKIRRAACSELYQRGVTGAGPRALWAQSLRLAWLAAAGGLRRLLARWAAILYGVYAWALLVPMGFFAVILAVALPRLAWRRHVAAVLARALASACGLRIHVTGAGHFPDKGAIALATNHASYLDGLVLTGVIPERCVFVAKRELADHFLARVLLDGIGTRYVERFDLERSVEAAHEMARIAAQGESLSSFPRVRSGGNRVSCRFTWEASSPRRARARP